MMKTLKIATRQSPLALWQAEHIRARLEAMHADLTVELVTFVTQGDKILDTPLAKIGEGLICQRIRSRFNGWACRFSRTLHERCTHGIA